MRLLLSLRIWCISGAPAERATPINEDTMKQNHGPVPKSMYVLLVGMVILCSSGAAKAEVELFKLGKDAKVSVAGEILARDSGESWFQSEPPQADNSYNYFFTRSRLSLALRHPYVGAFVQAQDVHMWGIPEKSIAPAPLGPLGIGPIYYMHNLSDSPHSLIIRQAYLDFPRLFAKGLSARIGRFDYADGQEVVYKNPKVTWLKNTRLSDRMIGAFDWSAFNRSFDGGQVVYDGKGFNLHSIAVHPTQGGYENSANKTISAIDVVTLTGTLKYGEWVKNTEGRLFYYYYNDSRNITNTPGPSGLEEGNIRINTFGTHWLHTEPIQSGTFDMLFWGAIQEGEWGSLDHKAWAAAVEGGFQFSKTPWKPWVRGGYFVSSGDSDPNDGEHGTFYQMLPTARKYALFPFYNLMNNEDLFIQAILKPKEALTIRADLHTLNLHEKNDLWYMGAGPTQAAGSIFGYLGRTSNGHDDLATVFEIAPSYTFSKYMSANLYYGHAFGSDVIRSIYSGDSGGDFFSIEFKAQF